MIVVDEFLDRVPSIDYKCFDFVREVWMKSFGEDITDRLAGLSGKDRKLRHSEMRKIRRVTREANPCVVSMQRGRTVPHVGIWWNGKVLHLAPTGAQYVTLDVAARRYPKVSFHL